MTAPFSPDQLPPAPRGHSLAWTTPSAAGSVFSTLASSGAQLERFAWVGRDYALALWRRETAGMHIAYHQPRHDTLAFYLRAGAGTARPGAAALADEQLCALPASGDLAWEVRGSLRFLHLYFMPAQFARGAVLEIDREPRAVRIEQDLQIHSPALAEHCHALAAMPWDRTDQLLLAGHTTDALMASLLRSHHASVGGAVRGGLAPGVRRMLAAHIEANLDAPLDVALLARLACTSEFHFARMFKLSFGMAPHAWVSARRVERARQLVQSSDAPLALIAERCGYTDASHFSHRFQAALGVTPGRYRQYIRAARTTR